MADHTPEFDEEFWRRAREMAEERAKNGQGMSAEEFAKEIREAAGAAYAYIDERNRMIHADTEAGIIDLEAFLAEQHGGDEN